MADKEWTTKILSKVKPARQHGSIFTVAAIYQDADYARVVAENIERRRAERQAEKEAAA